MSDQYGGAPATPAPKKVNVPDLIAIGQVLVLHDVLGLYGEFKPKFAKRYADIGAAVTNALREFDREVRDGSFPTDAGSFTMKDSELLSLQRSMAQQKAG